jgi:peroxiredoxin
MNALKMIAMICLVTLSIAVEAAGQKPAGKKSAGEATPGDMHELNIGDAAPEFSLPGIDGKTHTLAEYKDAKLLMIAFLSNHCPDSQASEGRIKKFVDDMKGQSFALVAINPNHPDALSPDELGYAKYSDSFDDMKKHAAEQEFNFPYLYDGETQATAKAYGCLATPHVFLFDAQRKLRYKGAFDDSRFADPATVKSTDARNAVAALLAGSPVPVEVTRPHGCSTKWLFKRQVVAEQNEKWRQTPVDVEMIDAAGVTALRKNGTPRLRLVNVWATSCAPCISEFPELVKTSRKFGMRDFELITISADDPKDAAKVKAFLEKQGAAVPGRLRRSLKDEGRTTNSYIFSDPDMNTLMNILDPQWPGGMPHTVLIGPDGRVLWRQNGPLDGDKLRDTILVYLGRFYKPQP